MNISSDPFGGRPKAIDGIQTGAAAAVGLTSTLVVRGRGTAEVVATGARSAVGRIGVALRSIRPEATPMQREMRRVVTLFAVLALASCALMIGLYLATRGGWLGFAPPPLAPWLLALLLPMLAAGVMRAAQPNRQRATDLESLSPAVRPTPPEQGPR